MIGLANGLELEQGHNRSSRKETWERGLDDWETRMDGKC